jgi:ABC-2 type transport system permease protein
MKELRLARKLIVTLVKDRVHYPGRLVVDMATMVARYGVLLLLYGYVFKLNGGHIGSTTFQVAAWSMFFYFSFSIFRLRYIAYAIRDDVRSGAIEILLSKPVSYLWYRIWSQVGAGLYPFLVIGTLGVTALALIVGVPTSMTAGIFFPTFALVALGGVLLSLFLYSAVGLLAFWIEEIDPVYWIVDKAVMILGGSYLPVVLFPNFLYQLARWSPFGASQFITHTVYESWQADSLVFIGIQFFWMFVFGAIIYFMFARAKGRISVNGG